MGDKLDAADVTESCRNPLDEFPEFPPIRFSNDLTVTEPSDHAPVQSLGISDGDLQFNPADGDNGGFSNLFGANVADDFPDDWSPLSPATGDDLNMDDLSGPCSMEPDVGTCFQPSEFPPACVDQEPVISSSTHDALFSRALLTNCDATGIELPWEISFYRELFDDTDVSLVPKMPISDACNFDVDVEPQTVAETVAGVAKFSDANPVHSLFVTCSDDVQFHVKRQQLRDAAIGKLLIVLRHCLLASSTGRHIINLGTDAQQVEGAYSIVDAVIGIRSSATLIKRANSLLSYLRWYARAGHSDVNPFVESFIWMYFQHLRENGAPATRADSALSAFRFAFHILGFECLESAVKSRRLLGLCEIMLAGKRLLRQALP
eukprot:s403_g14.t1